MANSAGADQTPKDEASYHGLHYLHKTNAYIFPKIYRNEKSKIKPNLELD